MSDPRTDVRLIKARVNVMDVLEKMGATAADYYAAVADEVSFYCPFCEDKDSRKPAGRANELSGLWHCFACNAGGDVITAVERGLGLGFNEALQWLIEEYPMKEADVDPWSDEQGTP